MELQAMLRTHLDDGFFRPELVRLGGENEELRQQMGRLQDAVITLRELADQREQWAGKLERDIDALHQETVVLQQLADQREQWAGKLERDIDALHQETVVLQQLAEQREHWAAKLESDIAEIRQLADQREQWAGKLEDDIVALRQSNASLFDEKQILASTVDGLRKTLCIRGTTWLRGQWAKVWQ
jgi:DNA repair exonuclease SbcCD ATPase subunit